MLPPVEGAKVTTATEGLMTPGEHLAELHLQPMATCLFLGGKDESEEWLQDRKSVV